MMSNNPSVLNNVSLLMHGSGLVRGRCFGSLQLAICLLISFFAASSSKAEEIFQQSLNGTTVVMMKVDSAAAVIPDSLQGSIDQPVNAVIKSFLQRIQPELEKFRQQMRGETAFFAVDMPLGPAVKARLLSSNQIPQAQLVSVAEMVWPLEIGSAITSGKWITVPLADTVDTLATDAIDPKLFPVDFDLWQAAWETSADFPLQIVLVPPAYFRKTFAELQPSLPAAFGGGSTAPLVTGFHWLSIGVNPRNQTAKVVLQTDSSQTAEEMREYVPVVLTSIFDSQLDLAGHKDWAVVVGLLEPVVVGDQITFSLENPQQTESLLQTIMTAAVATAKPLAQSTTYSKLRQLLLAMLNHESAFGRLPGYHGLQPGDKPSGLSWRVHILPFIGYEELWKNFKLDEPWDSPHNIQLLDQMPEIYQPVMPFGSSEVVKANHTTYVSPVGERTIFGRDRTIGFEHVIDGISNTIAIVELGVEHAIPWTSNEEYRYSPAEPAAKLRSVGGRVTVGWMDASVSGVRDDEPAAVWNGLFTIDGKEMVSPKHLP
ncbi:DUF1559 domain-containing protein [Planctomycetaceae bacterium SH139]